MAAIKVTASTFQTEVLQADKTVLVDFWASWCGPCQMMGPIVDQVADEHSEIKVCKVNVDDEQELAAKFGIASIPTLMVFKNGKNVNQLVGTCAKEKILAAVQ